MTAVIFGALEDWGEDLAELVYDDNGPLLYVEKKVYTPYWFPVIILPDGSMSWFTHAFEEGYTEDGKKILRLVGPVQTNGSKIRLGW